VKQNKTDADDLASFCFNEPSDGGGGGSSSSSSPDRIKVMPSLGPLTFFGSVQSVQPAYL